MTVPQQVMYGSYKCHRIYQSTLQIDLETNITNYAKCSQFSVFNLDLETRTFLISYEEPLTTKA